MNGADNSVFLDTNILVYASIPESDFHLQAMNAIESREQSGMQLWIKLLSI